ncbi:MAG: hypothetical protein JJE09_15400 [Bacteroidia bacterium]|nr:hypothetical protein [Bacteroidia bacterium]
MSRSLAVLLTLFVISFNLYSQEKPRKAARPNIPGSFMIDLGFNQGLRKPLNFNQGFWGSRTVNLYYQYPIRMGRSHFSFNPGIGASLERWLFTNKYVLADTSENSTEEFLLLPGSNFFSGIKKSMLATNYVEIPLEFRFDTAPEDLGRSFNVAIGGRIGYLFDSKMKVKYKEDGETKISKDKQNFGLTQIRYGVYTRIGVGSFNIFGFYNLTPLFEKGKGPDQTTMNNYTIGISINGF